MIKMNRALWVLAVAAIVAAGTLWGVRFHSAAPADMQASKELYYCPMHPNYTSNRPGTCPICNMSLVKREASADESIASEGHNGHESSPETSPKVFTVEQLVAMKPGEICLLHKCKMGQCMIAMTPEFARMGKCPHCMEDLGVIVQDAFPEGYTKIRLGTEKQQAIGVKMAPVQEQRLEKTLRVSGRIAYDPELYQAEEEYLQAVRALQRAENADPEMREQAEKLVDSARIKLRLLGLNDALVQELEEAGKPDRSLLYSDAGGKVWLYAAIYEYEMPFVHAGDPVEVEVPAISQKIFQGTIRSLDPVVDPVTRSIRVRAQLENPAGELKPEMYVNVSLRIDLGEHLAVPEEAVFMTGEKNIVFVAKESSLFEPRAVALGTKTDGFYQIQGGLQEGEIVVTSGNFLIDSESRLKAALEDAGGTSSHAHGG
ncbi:MAG: efflux RND transporter periplasmic adaptor subunit [Candidatus Omnitrophota bacterium]